MFPPSGKEKTMANYRLNQDLNGIEISFEGKPDADTIEALKGAGFRWHRAKKVWYAKQTADRITLAKSMAELTTAPIENPQKDLKAQYMDTICREVWQDAKMQDFIRKDTAHVVQLDNGDLYAIEKPSIKTHFCFGYGYCGVSTEDDRRGAQDAAHHAATNEQYFIDKNLECLNIIIEELNDTRNEIYKFVKYSKSPEGSKVKGIRYTSLQYNPEYAPYMWDGLRDLERISENERQALIRGYESVKEAFTKRLRAYLKRYGLTKLHTWTYLSD